MGKIVCNLATSVDGFIADENGGVDWLNDFQAEDYGMIEFFEQCGTAIMGSKTYEQALSFNSWFGKMEGVVFTSRKLPSFKNETINFVNGDPAPVVEELNKKEKDSWLVGGGQLITSFIDLHLLDELIITVVPRLLGNGLALCPSIKEVSTLQLLDSKAHADGVLQVRYRLDYV
ncbi:MAG TPA: dihydrofolate reductase family protein [Chitinophagaceae bacterium]|jgi:dihydrofolate reductase|nr:dihydrofolate reductase family protein [Chitinophagaceae bacterium]